MTELKSDIVTHHVTLKGALTFLRASRGRKFWVCGDIRLPIPSGEGDRYFPSYAVLKVSRAQAMRWASVAIGDTFEKRGGRLTLKFNDNNVWVG